jgi:methionine-rich copper-binding protein CopC
MKLKRISAVIAVLALLSIPSAFANDLVNTDPASASTISVSPSTVTITTSLPLMADGNSVEVTDPSGVRVDDGTLAIADNEAVVGLIPLTVGGYYTVTYNLLAENDVPLSGNYRFNFIAPATIASESPTPIATEVIASEQPAAGSSKGTDTLVIMMLVLSFFVLVGLGMYARKIFNER